MSKYLSLFFAFFYLHSVVFWDCTFYYLTGFPFLLTIKGLFRLARIKLYFCIFKSQRILYVSFSRVVHIYHFFVWSNLNLLHNTRWITFSSHVYIYTLSVLILLFWEFFTPVLVSVAESLLKSPRLVSLFWPIIIMLQFGWSPFVFIFQSPPNSVPKLWWLYRVHLLQSVSQSLLCSIVSSVLKQGLGTYLSFSFLSVLPGVQPKRRSLLFSRFFFFLCWLSQELVVWPRLDDPFVSQNLR